MKSTELAQQADARTAGMRRATVVDLYEDGSVLVDLGDGDGETLCDVLYTSEQSNLALESGDVVLIWRGRDTDRCVLMGRIGPSGGPEIVTTEADHAPDDLVIEATQNLTFRCGEGSITIRADGKILIKGQDLVSHALRVNRIKGGAVSIN